jgi:ADP-ribose pyrophosphatase
MSTDPAPAAPAAPPTVWTGKYLEVRKDGHWEYAARVGDMAAVVIVAVDEEGQLILVEQHRVPIGRRILELPAGLIGDEQPDETLEEAATRELEEETGYRPAAIERLGDFYSSPGMTSEMFTLVRATGLVRTGAGGGDDKEDITVLRVPVAEVRDRIRRKREAGVGIDAKLLLLLGAGLV